MCEEELIKEELYL